jgi:hypothetical protein
MITLRIVLPALTVSAALVALAARTEAIYVQPDIENVPVERIIANLSRQLTANPKDAGLHARLARVHAIAYARNAEEFPVLRRGAEPWFGPAAPMPPTAGARPSDPRAAARAREHLAQALVHYRAALAIDSSDIAVRLGYAWSLDQSGDRAAAIREYRAVIARAWPKERDKGQFGVFEESFAAEAGGYLRRLLDPVTDAREIAEIQARADQVTRMPRAITPIAIPMRNDVSADRILDGETSRFDADGSGVARRWTWITADAAWLVHDPRATGRITSALQLFGSVTFWMFWHDGYEALAALDDNGDGELRGSELAGLALWHDRNRNAVTDADEVKPLAAHGIVGLACRAVRTDGDATVTAWAPDGVTFADGTRRASYDLILHAATTLTH